MSRMGGVGGFGVEGSGLLEREGDILNEQRYI